MLSDPSLSQVSKGILTIHLQAYQHMIEPIKKDFWMGRKVEAPHLKSRRDIQTEVLGKAGGDMRTCLMDLPVNLLWILA